MGFLCIKKNDKIVVSQTEIKETDFLRNIGLNNVYNLKPEINVCSEVFLSPEYYVSGTTTGLVTGLTATLTGCTTGTTGIYNLTYTSDFNVKFIITGSTNYVNYDGNLCFKVFPKERFKPKPATSGLINGSEIINNCYSFSAITSSITKTFSEGELPKTWAEYLIRPYFTFKSMECNPGIVFNSWNDTVQLNDFQDGSDYYFMTIVDPPTPRLNPPGGIEIPNYTLVTDRLYVNGVSSVRGAQSISGNLNYFILSSIPSSGILLVLNGVQLTEDHDFRLITQGYSQPPIVEILNVIKDTDWLLATYISGGPNPWTTDFGVYFMDTILVDTFTNTATPSYRLPGDNSLNYNPVTLNYEFFTSLPIDPTSSIILTVNGVKLADDAQYFKSTSFDGRIIFDKIYTSFNTGDVISILTVSKDKGQNNNNYGSLKTNQFLVQWSVPPTFTNTEVTGRFIVQAFNDDTNALINQKIVDFVDGQANYESLLTNLPLNVNYRFKVTFEATYYAYLNNEVITCSYSEGYFDTTNSYIKNTY